MKDHIAPILEELRKAREELETLRTDNAKLIAERDLYKNNCVAYECNCVSCKTVFLGEKEQHICFKCLLAERDMLKLCADQNEDEVKKKHSELDAMKKWYTAIEKWRTAVVDECIRAGLPVDESNPSVLIEKLIDFWAKRALKAEREAMMNQEPAGYIVKDTKNNLEWLTTIQNPEKYKRDYPDFVLTPVYASPLPAQQIHPFPVLSSDDSVPMPANADQAVAMTILSESWLKRHAPERLKAQQIPEGYALVSIEPTDEMDREYTLKSGQSHLSVKGYKAMLSASKKGDV